MHPLVRMFVCTVLTKHVQLLKFSGSDWYRSRVLWYKRHEYGTITDTMTLLKYVNKPTLL